MVQLRRQDELTRRIQGKRMKASKRSKAKLVKSRGPTLRHRRRLLQMNRCRSAGIGARQVDVLPNHRVRLRAIVS